MATPNDSTVFRNPKDFSGKMPDDVWLSKAKQEQFSSYFSDIIDELAAKAASFSPLDNGKRIRRILEHVIPGGNNFPGVMIAETYKILTPQHKRTPENLKLAYYLGWCYEVVMESFNLADDIFDESQTRRDRICWYQLPDVGPRAVNDTLMIEIAAGYTDLHALKEAKSIITDINYLYTIQNDFYDCFGDPKVMGKVTSDITKGRCRWPAVVAMKLANPEQKEIMKSNYGREDPESYYLGWCYEVVMESFNLADDIFDEGQTRRDRICWYQLPDVGPRAVNDTLMIEIAGYYLLRKYFGNLECYTRLLKLINEFTFQVCIGQNLDVDVSKDLDKLTFDTYREIIGTTTLYVVGYNPIALGMTLAGYTDLHVLKEAKSIIADINYFYIIQNDFYDSFGDP
uniref:Putative polyprenyl synthetase n=1 Tax=Lutzomyia longipalpis TaxID=7200 RepID=A0A1B0CWL0_LUTLO